jgi:hypothetical protein
LKCVAVVDTVVFKHVHSDWDGCANKFAFK